MITMKTVLIIALIMVHGSPAFAALKLNDEAPAFSLRDNGGKDFILGDYAGSQNKEGGSGVILSFFASWCVPCRNELLLMNSLVEELKGKGVQVVIIGVKEDFDKIGPLLAELKVNKPLVLSDLHGKISGKYQVRFLPTTFFISADGKVKDISFGEIKDAAELREHVGKLTNK
jgi:peroxiredoxin